MTVGSPRGRGRGRPLWRPDRTRQPVLSDSPDAAEDVDQGSEHRWGLTDAVIGFGVGIVLASLATLVAESITGYRSSSGAPFPIAVTAADVGGLWFGLVGSAVWSSRAHGTRSLARDFGYRVGAWWDLPFGAAVGLACQYGLIPALYAPFEKVDKSLRHQIGQPAHRETGAAHSSWAVVALFVVLAVGAPLVEELFFRGLVLRGLLGRFPAPIAIVVSALLFGLAHFEAVQFGGLAAFGVVLGVMAWKLKRLAPGVGAHVAFNAAAVLSVVHLR